MLESNYCSFPAFSLLVRMGWVAGEIDIKTNSAQMELDLGLSFANSSQKLCHFLSSDHLYDLHDHAH